MLKALADPTRLRIMLLLMKEELCVCELETVLGMEQSRISHALRALRDANLIDERRESRWVFYKASQELPSSLLHYIDESAEGSVDVATDRRKAAELLRASKPQGKRCPLREK